MTEKEEKVATAEVGILTLINKKLKEILEIQKQQIPEGVPVNFEDIAVTSEPTRKSFTSNRPYRALFRIDVYNAGPNTVYIRVNDSEEIAIEPYRTIPFDYKKAAIKDVQLRTNTGETATVDITGLY